MTGDTIRSIHRWGAVLSAALVGGSVFAFVLEGSASGLGVLLGLFGPLFGFYFVGAELQYSTTFAVVGEELLRGVVWYFGSLVGWAYILTGSETVPVSGVAGVALPAGTAVAIVLGLVAIRYSTGLELKIHSGDGYLLASIAAAFVGGFGVLYLVLVWEYSWVWLPLYVVAMVLALGYWSRAGERVQSPPQ